VSDGCGDVIACVHAIHGSDHHVIAFVKADGPGLHHLSWDVPSINHIGLGAMQMADKGFTAGWGLGRHVLGSNYFHYVRDPWGSYSEYSSDVDYIPADHDWKGGDHPPEDSFYVWGPTAAGGLRIQPRGGIARRRATAAPLNEGPLSPARASPPVLRQGSARPPAKGGSCSHSTRIRMGASAARQGPWSGARCWLGRGDRP